MSTEKERYDQSKAEDNNLSREGGFGVGEVGQKSSQQMHQELNETRIRDGKQKIRQQTSAFAKSGTSDKKKSLLRKTKIGRALHAKNEIKDGIKTAKSMALAFTAIDPMKDWVHFVVITFSIIADLFTLLPVVGSLFAIFFSIIIWLLYAIDGHFKKLPGRKILTMAMAQFPEILGAGFLPLFTASAILNYWFALVDKKVMAKQTENN